MWKTEHFLFRWMLWVLTQIYSKTRLYWNYLSQSVSKFLQRQPIPTHYLPEMLRLILKELSRTYFTSCHPPNVKKGFVKGEALRILWKNSSETTFEEKKTLDGRRLPTIFDRKPTIRNKIHKRESRLLKQNNKEEKEILPFVTQYQPSVSTIKEAWMKKWSVIQNQLWLE